MTSPIPTLLQASVQAGGKFDRNAASRMLGQEFAALRQKYGDTAIRAAGFTPRTLAQMQAPLRALQMSNTSTLDAHQSAINDALAKLRSYNFGGSQAAPQAPVQRPAEPQGTLLPYTPPMPEGEVVGQMQQPSPMASLMANLKTMAQPAQSNPAFVGQNFTGSPPPPGMKWVETGEGLVPVPINEGAAPSAPSGPALGSVLGSVLGSKSLPPVGATPAAAYGGISNLLKNSDVTMPEPEREVVPVPQMLQMPEPEREVVPVPQVPMTAQALVPYSPPSPPPKPFDRNAASRQFNQQFSTMFKTLGDSGFRTQGFTPRDLAQLQAGLRKLQMDNTSTPEQHQAALQNALNTLNSRVMMPVSQAPQMQAPVPQMPPNRNYV